MRKRLRVVRGLFLWQRVVQLFFTTENTEKAPRKERGFAWPAGCVVACRRCFLTTELTENTERLRVACGLCGYVSQVFFNHRAHREHREAARGLRVVWLRVVGVF